MGGSRIVGIVSCKGGVGKTTTTVNLALAMHQLGQNVTVIDGDMSASTLGFQLGINSCPHTTQDLLQKKSNILEMIYIHPTGLRLIPSSIALEHMKANTKNIGRVLRQLNDLVLIDAPAGLSDTAIDIIKASDEILVVTNPDMPAVLDAMKVVQLAGKLGKKVGGIILNRVKGDSYELRVEEVETTCGTSVVAVIPEDKNIKKSLFMRMPIVALDPYSKSSIAFQRLGAELAGKHYEPPRMLFLKRLFGNRI